MSSLAVELVSLLEQIDRPGKFCTSGRCDILAPGLAVVGIGSIALPLIEAQMKELVAIAEPAPYGRGEETLIDQNVRRSWQIGADKVAFSGRNWPATLEMIVSRAAEGLGIAGPVKADLYKLLVYDAGGFFIEHRDTEKTEGMFATLVIVLPSAYDGGELIVRHGGEEVRLDLHSTDPSEIDFAAFYADCRHEVLPVEKGCRLTLIYNLSRPGIAPTPPAYNAEQDRLADLLAAWNEDEPLKLVVPLDHAYTQASLSFDALKGVDVARAGVLAGAAYRADCDLHLALVTVEENGWAQYSGNYGRHGWSGEYDDEFEVGEVDDRSQTLSDWQSLGSANAAFGPLPFDEAELAPPDLFNELEPIEQSFQEATGNEGASFERTYRLAAFVLWPRRHRLAVLAQGGLGATLPVLAQLAEQVSDNSGLPGWAEAHELSKLMLASWPVDSHYVKKETATFLDCLIRLGDCERLQSFLADHVAAGNFDDAHGDVLVRALRLFRGHEASQLAARFTASPATLEARAAFLARCESFDALPAAQELVDRLPGKTGLTDKWGRPRGVDPTAVIDVIQTLARLDPVLLAKATDIMLTWPKVWDKDRVLIPAVLKLNGVAPRLHEACVAHLRERVAQPLAPPTDWTRDARVSCTCQHCADLARFLADPAIQIWHFKAAQVDRSHVEATIANRRCDVDVTTLRKGSPHTLVCTKNQASYERKAHQRRNDLVLLERL